MSKDERVITIDPDLYMKRMLHYREKHSAWYIFQSLYWGIFLFLAGFTLVLKDVLNYSLALTLGIILIILSLMVILYGFVTALHMKLMKRYA